MKIQHWHIARTFCLLIIFGMSSRLTLHAQVGYLDQVGSSEVELMMFLRMESQQESVKRQGALINLEQENVQATYTVQRGSVVHVSFHQSFSSEADVMQAYDTVKHFLEERGVGMQAMRGMDHYRLVTGEGNGLRSTLVITSSEGHYKLNAELIAMR